MIQCIKNNISHNLIQNYPVLYYILFINAIRNTVLIIMTELVYFSCGDSK